MNKYVYNSACGCPRCRMRSLHGAALIITVGVLFLLQSFGIADFGQTWPVLIIVVGLFSFGSNTAPIDNHIQPMWVTGRNAPPVPPVPPPQDPQVKP